MHANEHRLGSMSAKIAASNHVVKPSRRHVLPVRTLTLFCVLKLSAKAFEANGSKIRRKDAASSVDDAAWPAHRNSSSTQRGGPCPACLW